MTEWKWTGEAGSKPRYEYDALNQLRRRKAGDTVKAQYAYTADGERVYEHNLGTGTDTYVYTIRGLDKQVRRLFTKTQPSGGSATWSFKDHIRRSGQMLASYSPTEGVRHYDLDHLGTVRYVTNRCRQEVAWHAYYGYGEEAEPFDTTDMERVRFTGHERDMQGTTGTLDDLDYMHGRYYNPNLGRFLSCDPASTRETVKGSQLFNRFTYALGNPLGFNDPDGLVVNPITRRPGIDPVPAVWRPGKIRRTERNSTLGLFGSAEYTGREREHTGIDISGQKGLGVYAAADGVVRFLGKAGKGGNTIILWHPKEAVSTVYCHLLIFNPELKVGQTVRENSFIGAIGDTGNANGQAYDEMHLHFGVKDHTGKSIDPVQWLKFWAEVEELAEAVLNKILSENNNFEGGVSRNGGR